MTLARLFSRETAIRSILAVLSVVVSLIVIELGGRLFLRVSPIPLSIWEFRRTQPPPYQSAPYFSAEFLRESRIQPGQWITPPGTTLVLPDNFHGVWFNVRNYCRVTTHQPAQFANVIYLLGGSTVYDSEVPDEYTIASQLQQLAAGRYLVENLGVTTVNTRQQLERLKTFDPRPNDIVAFYDGVNDIIQGITYRNPRGWIVGDNRIRLAAMSPLDRLMFRIYQRYSNRSAIVRLAFHRSSFPDLPYLHDSTQLEQLVAETSRTFKAVLLEAGEYTSERGAIFYHFLQPNLFTQRYTSAYEQGLLRNYNLAYPGFDIAFGSGYPALRDVGAQLRREGLRSHDVSDAFDVVARDGEHVYLDYAHTAHRGNRIIAEKIWSVLSRDTPDTSSRGPESAGHSSPARTACR